MRLYLKKVVQWLLGVSIFVVVLLNLYKRDVWVYDNDRRPWGPNFEIKEGGRKKMLFDGPRIHDHASRGVRNMTTGVKQTIRDSVFNSSVDEDLLVYYDKHFDDEDRILNQLKFVPKTVKEAIRKGKDPPMKTILIHHGFGGWNIKRGQQTFIDQKCAVNRCFLTDDRGTGSTADAVFFSGQPGRPWTDRPQNQIWVLFMLESPYHTSGLSGYKNVFNWTATYRHDSTIVAPYEKFVPYNSSVLTKPQNKNYAKGKTKKVAWFVSNCGARNGRRRVADELAHHIQVDIYGACGKFKCPRFQSNKCFDMLNREYKFYLSFENSNCRDYITEKFFVNGLQHDVIPIVMGAAPEDYRRSSPPHSYIHVDDFPSIKDLADYLTKLDQNDDLYNEYFRWKGTGSLINTFFWCRMCNLLHDKHAPTFVSDIEAWWRGEGVCIGQDSWRDKKYARPKL
ncbi:glycoprotein 3-alpha-L-fucosyltransferase A-like [Gigantopelta aegis]|uniref:glycoprotein 3-alpha-L-fucosyltransferase A-like n=1 Tax=Gigantopelta aegis TaxID=1735272 RepID=UPI001B8875DA|nr:glycoprotein 3-alpha-L-fucosyltransferase A-like [Gigantopelta aegis]